MAARFLSHDANLLGESIPLWLEAGTRAKHESLQISTKKIGLPSKGGRFTLSW